MTKDQSAADGGIKITSNFKMGSIDRLNTQLKESREEHGERKLFGNQSESQDVQDQKEKQAKRE